MDFFRISLLMGLSLFLFDGFYGKQSDQLVRPCLKTLGSLTSSRIKATLLGAA